MPLKPDPAILAKALEVAKRKEEVASIRLARWNHVSLYSAVLIVVVTVLLLTPTPTPRSPNLG